MNDAESILIGVAIWVGGALLLYLILKCVFNGRKGGQDDKVWCGMCTPGESSKGGGGCFPLNFQFTHFYQLFYCLAAFFIIVWGTYYIFGMNAVNSLLTGFMIGGGLALKPLMKTVVSGFTADGVNLMGKQLTLKVGDKELDVEVVRIGLLHTWVSPKDGEELIMVHNDLLNKQPLRIKNVQTTNTGDDLYPRMRPVISKYVFT